MPSTPSSPAVALKQVLEDMAVEGELYETLDDGRLLCYACGHECKIPDGRPGVCRVRYNAGGQLHVPSGYVSTIAVDPIEKKPFFHAFPGRDALSFGMLGCDLHCAYCQNWVTSQTLRDDRAVSRVHQVAPDRVADLAIENRAPVVASTYNEPLITTEWAMQIMRPAVERGLIGAYVSNGNATRRVLNYIRPYVSLYKVDLKTFSDREYRRLGGQLDNVKRTIRQLFEMEFWVEIVTLIVPGLNDSDDELKQMADFLVGISPDIPWHVTAFHSDYKMRQTPSTQVAQLIHACEIGAAAGLRYIYAGNLPGMVGDWEHTRCPRCRTICIERQGFMIRSNRLVGGNCPDCAEPIAGFWGGDDRVPAQP
ncbi:MAG: AmmeMemoRadiSam system radical SAM enzyme [Planctomycetaceae bacterium]|nr:AmmeMemoRadiSam system radical SAM enzyme [Planctomycetaceae bacterium]